MLVQIVNLLIVYTVVAQVGCCSRLAALLEKRRENIAQGLEDARVAAEARANAEKEAAKIVAEAQAEASKVVREANERAQGVAKEVKAEAEAEAAKAREAALAESEVERNSYPW